MGNKINIQRVHELRKKGLSQSLIADELGVSRSAVSYALRRHPLPKSERPKVIIARSQERSQERSQKNDLILQQERILKIMERGEWFSHRGLAKKLNSDEYITITVFNSILKSMQGLMNRRLVERRKLFIEAKARNRAGKNRNRFSSWCWVYRLKVS